MIYFVTSYSLELFQQSNFNVELNPVNFQRRFDVPFIYLFIFLVLFIYLFIYLFICLFIYFCRCFFIFWEL